MTEPQQMRYEELMQQLQQEESYCENCGMWKEYGLAGCEGCGTYGNKRTLEEMMAEMIL
jgi:hypothetical protein